MTFSAKTRYLLVTLAILTASVIELVRGVPLWVVLMGAAGVSAGRKSGGLFCGLA